MRTPEVLVMHLVGWATEELAAQRRLLESLDRQEKAVLAHDRDAVEAETLVIAESVRGIPGRKRRRDALLTELASVWQVAVSALTLGSIAERQGASGQRLNTLRGELREATEEVVRRNRRLGALIGLHRRVGQDVLELLFTDGSGNPLEDEGTLVNAEA